MFSVNFLMPPRVVHVVGLNQSQTCEVNMRSILTCWPPGGRKYHPKNEGYPKIIGYPKIDDGPLPDKVEW